VVVLGCADNFVLQISLSLCYSILLTNYRITSLERLCCGFCPPFGQVHQVLKTINTLGRVLVWDVSKLYSSLWNLP